MGPNHDQISGLTEVLSTKLIRHVVSKYSLNPRGTHGTSHWMRVRQNGIILSEETGANHNVVELFALFHDSRRNNEGYDDEHVREWVNEQMGQDAEFPYVGGARSLLEDARTEWIDLNERLVDVEVWCDKHLSDEQLVQLSGAVRRARQH